MGTYADKLRELADLLDEDFTANVGIVILELLAMARNLYVDNIDNIADMRTS